MVYAQLETGERGILPIDSSGTLEIGGIHVDVGGKDRMSARYAGWRIAQREGFRALWAKTHNAPDQPGAQPAGFDARPDRQLDQRRARADRPQPLHRRPRHPVRPSPRRAFLGVEGARSAARSRCCLSRSLVTGGTATTVELRNGWQRAWAQFRTSQSPIDYVRVSGLGVDPLLVNAAQIDRPGRGWWRNLVDLYGAADILVAEVQLQRLYPGGPARARFIARHGPDNEIVGGFT